MSTNDTPGFVILAWPLICLALYLLREAGRALYRAVRTHTRSSR